MALVGVRLVRDRGIATHMSTVWACAWYARGIAASRLNAKRAAGLVPVLRQVEGVRTPRARAGRMPVRDRGIASEFEARLRSAR